MYEINIKSVRSNSRLQYTLLLTKIRMYTIKSKKNYRFYLIHMHAHMVCLYTPRIKAKAMRNYIKNKIKPKTTKTKNYT